MPDKRFPAGRGVHVTVTGPGKKHKPRPAPAEVRHGPFTRPEDDLIPVPTLADVLWVYKDALGLRAFDLTKKASPSKPVDTLEVGGILSQQIQQKRAIFDTSSLVNVTKKKPVQTAVLDLDGTPTGLVGDVTIWLKYNRFSLFANASRLQAHDATDITAPTLIADYSLPLDFAAPQFSLHENVPWVGFSADGNYVYNVASDTQVFTGTTGQQLTLCAYNTANPLSVIQGTPQVIGYLPTNSGTGIPWLQPIPTLVVDDVLYIGYSLTASPLGLAPYTSYIATYSLTDPMNPSLTNLHTITDLYGNDPTQSQTPFAIHVNKARTWMVVLTSFEVGGAPPVAGIGDPFLMLFDVSGGLTSPVLVDRKSITTRAFLDPTPVYLQFSDTYLVGDFCYAPLDFGTTSANLAVYNVSGGTFNLVNTVDMQSDAGGGTMRSILALSIQKKGEPL